MRFADHLTKEQVRKFNQHRHTLKEKKKPPIKKESLSQRDLEELMGTRRDIYKRVNGAVRRK